MKRRMLHILSILLLMLMLPVKAEAATVIDSGKLGDFANWELTDNGTLTVSGRYQLDTYYIDLLRADHETDIKTIVINLQHRDVEAALFTHLPNLESVDFSGSSVEVILRESMDFCPKLESVILPDTIKEIQAYAFADSPRLTEINFPEGLETIGEGAFIRTSLSSVVMPDSLRTIGQEAFLECETLTSVTLNEGLETLGIKAFYDCVSLTGKLYLPASLSVNGVGYEAFGNCKSFTSLVSHVDITDNMFENSLTLTSAKIIGNATYISNNAFFGCSNLAEVELGSSLERIGGNAFTGCEALTEITLPDSLTSISGGAFSGSGIEQIILPSSVTSLSMGAFQNCTSLESADLSRVKLDMLENYMFSGCSKLSTVKMPDTTVLGGSVFANCTSLEEIYWPNNLESIMQEAFQGCIGLIDVALPETVTSLGQQAFLDCINLKSITIPENMQTISASTFAGCSNLESFVIYSMDMEFPDLTGSMFEDCPNVTIYAYAGSTAEAYANACDISFVRLTDGDEHNYDEGRITVAPTCTEPGTITYTCIDCSESYTSSIKALGHDYTDAKADYHAEDKTHGVDCTRCGETKYESCTFGDAVITTEASLNNMGVKTYTCTVCGGSYEEEFVYRIYGKNRYQTAFSTANALKEQLGVEKFDNVVIASGLQFADALAGSYLAAVKNAPILLVNSGSVAEVAEYVEDNLADGGTIYLLGGSAAVPVEMETALEGLTVKRLSGKNRFGTNLAILEEAGVGDDEILVCTGWGFADSLSASAVGKPILLVNTALTEEQKEFLEESSGRFVIIGGTGAVNAEVQSELMEYGSVARLSGKTRYETSVLVAERFFDDPDTVLLAYGQNFPDGLCGGPLAWELGAPLILCANNNSTAADTYVQEKTIAKGAVLGGASLISDATAMEVFTH